MGKHIGYARVSTRTQDSYRQIVDFLATGVRRGDLHVTKSGFTSTEHLLSKGRARSLQYNKIAELVSHNPAQQFSLSAKENLADGYAAGFYLLEASVDYAARPDEPLSTQGFNLIAKVSYTHLRGETVLHGEGVVGSTYGQFILRPGNK